MNNYANCIIEPVTLEKAAPAPSPKPIKEKLMRSQTIRSIPLVTIVPKEKQQKYLGLVIEKDEEQLVEISSTSEFEVDSVEYQQPVADPIKRVYKPIREKYITIVKNSRKLYL